MLKRTFQYTAIFLHLIVILVGCTDLYEPELNVTGSVFYVEGSVTNLEGPQKIRVREAVPYNAEESFKAVSNATVYVMENGATRYDFTYNKGIYLSDSSFSARQGESYQLFIEGPDGELYQSVNQTMPLHNNHIDSVYGYKESQKIKYYNTYNELIIKEEEVNQLYVDIPAAPENTYYRFESLLYLQHAARYIIYPYASEATLIPYYMYDAFPSSDLSIIEVNSQIDKMAMVPLAKALNDNEEYISLKLEYSGGINREWSDEFYRKTQVEVETDTGFISVDTIYYGIPVELDEAKDFFYGWVVEISQYSITRDAYTFWSDVKKLEEAEGELFDPIATQLRGNITCISNAEKVMSGLFEVAYVSTSKGFVNFDPYNGIHYGKTINSDYRYQDGFWQDSIPPDNWINEVSVY